MKIILISPMLQPYRISFYEKLSKCFKDFKVYYQIKQKEDGKPHYDKKVSFDARSFLEYKISFLGFSILLVKEMFEAIKEEHPDIIILQAIPGNLTYHKIVNWAKRNKIKIVFWYCGWVTSEKRFFLLQEFKKRLSISQYKKGDYFITYSTKAKNDLLKQKFSSQIIKVAFNGIELDDYRNTNNYFILANSLREKYAEDNMIYLSVGALTENKRVLFLIDAFIEFNEHYKNTQLWIIGDGPQRTEIDSKINNHTSIKYFGRIVENVEAYFIAADYFVLPGAGGLAINQAQFFETPCIVGRADGTEQDLVIENLTGFNFIEDNKSSLISKLIETYNMDEETLSKMKEKGKELIIERSNVNNMVRVFDEVLTEIKQHT